MVHLKAYRILRIGARILCIRIGLGSKEFSVLAPEFLKNKGLILQPFTDRGHPGPFNFLRINADSGSASETFAGSLPRVKNIQIYITEIV